MRFAIDVKDKNEVRNIGTLLTLNLCYDERNDTDDEKLML
jgi:hypothetical protein